MVSFILLIFVFADAIGSIYQQLQYQFGG